MRVVKEFFVSLWQVLVLLGVLVGLLVLPKTLEDSVGAEDPMRILALLFAAVCLALLVIKTHNKTSVKFAQGVDVICNMLKILKSVPQKKGDKSLYYCGAAGFIGDYKDWRDLMEKVMKTKEVTLKRLIDLKEYGEIKDVFTDLKKEEEMKQELKKYLDWLKLHKEYIVTWDENNFFYDFEGAPLWKYGIHVIVFNKKDIALVFLSKDESRNAILIRNRPEIGEAITNCIDWHGNQLQAKGYRVTAKKLQDIINEGKEKFKKDFGSDIEG
jgi:hypothetical protein